MRPHLTLLGILQMVWGGFGLILGLSTLFLALGAVAIGLSRHDERVSAVATAIVFGLVSAALLVGGLANAWAGRSLRRHEQAGRLVTMGLAVPNLFVLPFGTALGIYAFWVLLHEETRRAFGLKSQMEMEPDRKTASGLDPNVAAALSYGLGWITGVGFLLTERENRFVRFHAMQSTIVFGALSLLCLLLQSFLLLGVLLAVFIVIPLSAVLWLVLMFKAYQGERFKLPYAGDMAEERV